MLPSYSTYQKKNREETSLEMKQNFRIRIFTDSNTIIIYQLVDQILIKTVHMASLSFDVPI